MDSEVFYAILSAVVFPFMATGAMTWLTLGRRRRPALAAASWIAGTAIALILCYLWTDHVFGITMDEPAYGIAGDTVETTLLICVISFTAVWTATTLACHTGTASSKIMVSLVYSSICITVLVATDAAYSLAIGPSHSLEHLKGSALAHLILTLVAFVPLSMALPERMRAMIDRTEGRMTGYLPVPILIFAVTTAELYARIYFDGYTRQSMYGALGICVLTAICLFLLVMHTSGTIRIHGYRRELDAARVIQTAALGACDRRIEGLAVDALMLPAKDVAGDFYSIVDTENGGSGIVVADVSDKGVPAAMFMMKAKTLIDERLAEGMGPAECLTEVNEVLMRDNESCMFVTVLIIVRDGGGHLRIASAGHPYPLLRRKGEVTEIPAERGPMLGLMPHIYEETGFDMEADDMMLMFTDGATDCEDLRRDQFGMERLKACLAESGDDACERIADRLAEFSKGADLADDVTLVSVGFPDLTT